MMTECEEQLVELQLDLDAANERTSLLGQALGEVLVKLGVLNVESSGFSGPELLAGALTAVEAIESGALRWRRSWRGGNGQAV